jgi:hypothetical protein
MPEQLKYQIKKKSTSHEEQDSSVFFFIPRIIFSPPGEKNPQEKNDSPDSELID